MAMQLQTFSYRFADEVLASNRFRAARDGALSALTELPSLVYGVRPWSKSAPKPSSEHPVEQAAMNRWLDDAFKSMAWDLKPQIIEGSGLAADYKKDRVQVEVQFGNMARWAYDVFKFQVSYSQGAIDVGILAVPMARFCPYINSNVAQYERVLRELPHAKLSITLPILVIGVEPMDYGPLPSRVKGTARLLRST